MIRIRNFLPLVALLVGAAILGVPARACALFEVMVSSRGSTTNAYETDIYSSLTPCSPVPAAGLRRIPAGPRLPSSQAPNDQRAAQIGASTSCTPGMGSQP